MHLAPIFSRQLHFMPFDLGHPVWVEADEVDLDFHIRKVPGAAMTVRQAEAMAAKLHGQLIDREHPLWEFHVFDSIKPPAGMALEGRLVGFYSKIHHAALDGKGGTVLANAVMDLGADATRSGAARPRAQAPHGRRPEDRRDDRRGVLQLDRAIRQAGKVAARAPRAPSARRAPA